MKQRTFFIWNVLGAIGWGFEWVGAGYVFSQSLKLAQVWLSRAGFLLGSFVLLLIGFIRLYLGVYYPSDVYAGYLVGAMWLITGISMCEWVRRGERRVEPPPVPRRAWISSVALVSASVVFYCGFAMHYVPPATAPAMAKLLVIQRPSDIFPKTRLKYTETIAGERLRRINLIIVARNDQDLVD